MEVLSEIWLLILFSSAGTSLEDASLTAKLLAAELPDIEEHYNAKKDWKIGDRCLAIWSEDGQ